MNGAFFFAPFWSKSLARYMRDFFLDGLDVVVRHFNLLRFKFETNYNTIINRFSRIMINSKEPFP